ncbi:MAG: tetratricopeptide repeat protein [Acidimicrobiia bacterium]
MTTVHTLPSGTVTFLFTDIQGSTQLWDAFPDEMRTALGVHDQIIGDAVSSANGAVVKNTGDGIFAAFSEAPDGVVAAVDAQRRIAAYEWDPVIDSLEVRMALHTAVVEPVDGDYHGPAINRVARIEAAGHGGQILLSDAAQEAAADALPADMEIVALGTHSLRGLSRPETIHQLVVPGVRSAFPPLRTASVAVGVLPEFATSFVGRSADIEGIAEQFAAPDCRVVTALGPGGIGKTRLSVEAARHIGETSSSVAHFVSLAAVPSPEAIIREIAESLNFTIDLHIASMVDETTQVLDLLQNQRMILVLDNFEHLLSGAAIVTRIVESAPDVDVLVTSRERLGIGSEWVYEVGGLDVGEGGESDQRSEAVELFVERARRAGGSVPSDSEHDVSSLCAALGGMPLAIELAAAWTPALPVSEIAFEVQSSLDFLAGTLADMPERHRSVRAAFDHSWKRLDVDLRDAFSSLNIFPAPFTREAAAEVAGTQLPTLLALMNKSLLRRADLDTYDIHPLLRELGLEELGDEREIAARKHAEFYVGRLLDREQRLRGSIEQIEIKDEVAAELGNLRAATVWAAADNLPTAEVVGILNALQAFYFLYSWAEAIDHFEEIAAAVEERVGFEASVDDDRYLWAKTLAMNNLSQFGNVDQVTGELTRLLPHWEQRGGAGLAWCLVSLGIAAEQAGDLAEARSLFERAEAIGFGDDGLLYIEHASWYGWVIIEQGNAERAREIFQDGLDVAERDNTYPGRAYTLSKLGVAADELGNHEEAAEYHHESREIFVKSGDLGGQGYTLSRLSWTYWLMGDYVKAKRYGEEGLEKFDEINHRWGVAASWCRIGLGELGLGDFEAAAEAFRAGLSSALSHKMQTLVYYALMGMGRLYAEEGRTEDAVRLLAQNVEAPENPYANLAQETLDDLGEQVTEELRQAGAEMSLDEAVALAKGE